MESAVNQEKLSLAADAAKSQPVSAGNTADTGEVHSWRQITAKSEVERDQDWFFELLSEMRT